MTLAPPLDFTSSPVSLAVRIARRAPWRLAVDPAVPRA